MEKVLTYCETKLHKTSNISKLVWVSTVKKNFNLRMKQKTK